jgi:hypothetical protein
VKSSCLCVRVFGVLVAASPLFAQWQSSPALNTPPARSGFALVPWPSGGVLVFGGDSGNPAATELLWNGIGWSSLTTPVPRRESPAIARNDADGSLLVHGGKTAAGAVLSDTWTFSNGVWSQVVTPTSPGQTVVAMAFDPTSAGMVLVTQPTPPIGTFATWRFAAGDWVPVNTFSVLAGQAVSMFSDTVRGEVCLVISANAGISVHRLVGTTWTQVDQKPGAPTATWSTFDPERGRAVLLRTRFSGWEPYEYDGRTLAAFAPQALPYVAPGFGGIAFQRERHEAIFVGATLTGLQAWRWVAAPQPMATPFAAPCASAGYSLGLAAGDSPQPGGSHRLRVGGSSLAGLQLAVLGLSHTQNGGLPLPQPIPLGAVGCTLRVEALSINFVGVGLPAQQLVTVPASSTLLGARYDAQFVQIDASGVTDASNGLEVQLGLPLPEHALAETFATDAQRDAAASGDTWANGEVVPVAIGGDGRHGSFDASIGTLVAPGVYTWSTDNMLVPASRTISGQAQIVTDGRFYFSDFVVPAGVTVKFTGSVPVQIFVRGRVDVQGTIDGSAADMPHVVPASGPLAGQRATNRNCRTPQAGNGAGGSVVQVEGQPGGGGGPGGANGGAGGRECLGSGPIVIGGVMVTDGQNGGNVRVFASHAYASQVASTGGRGSPMNPATGLTVDAQTPTILVGTVAPGTPYRARFSAGGSGGGFMLAGAQHVTTPIPTPSPLVNAGNPGNQPVYGTVPPAAVAFPLLPLPASPPVGYQSLDHFLVGGSGGGGGGTHPFGLLQVFIANDGFIAGHGGSGGGGALMLRAGGSVTIAATAQLLARGGAGVVISGDDPTTSAADSNYGISAPGGGGSGGSFLVQSGGSIGVGGLLDTSGGAGSRTQPYGTVTQPTQFNLTCQAGAGSPGFYRLEAAQGVGWNGAPGCVPSFNAATNTGVLTDVDQRTGSRSLWYLPSTTAQPMWLR